VLDADLSGLDAASVARLVRAHESRVGGRVKIVAVSIEPVEGQSPQMVEAGIDACLAKPLEHDHLAWTITRLCRDDELPEAGAA